MAKRDLEKCLIWISFKKISTKTNHNRKDRHPRLLNKALNPATQNLLSEINFYQKVAYFTQLFHSKI